jgi:hypothetical protein
MREILGNAYNAPLSSQKLLLVVPRFGARGRLVHDILVAGSKCGLPEKIHLALAAGDWVLLVLYGGDRRNALLQLLQTALFAE